MDLIPPKIERYAAAHSSPSSRLFDELVRQTRRKTRWPQMQVDPLEGRFLTLLVRLAKARRVLEIGTFTGMSALRMAEGLPPSGRLITLDVDPDTTAIARAFWRRHPAGKKITLKLGPALESLRSLKGPFDVAFIDADKTNYLAYWTACVPKVRRGGLVIVDNVLWSGRVLSPRDADDRAIAAFNRRVRADRRVDLVMLTVRDGMTLAVKR